MTLPVINSRNPSQGLPLKQAVGRKTSTATVWYTCPAGKKAFFDGVFSVDAFGAATEIWISIDGAGGTQVSRRVAVADVDVPVKGVLEAGETLGYDQNSGTNGTVDASFIVQEYPI